MNPEDRVRDLFRGAEENRTATEGEWADFSRRAHRRLAVRRFAAGAGAAALVAAGVVGFTVIDFGGDESSPPPAVSPTDSGPTPDTSPTPAVTVPDTIQELWFVKDGKLVPTGITPVVTEPSADVTPPDDAVAYSAAAWLEFQIFEVVPGPVTEAGETTAIPKGTKLLSVEREGTTLTVELDTYFDENQDTPESLDLAMAQIVYTATQFDGIDEVRFLLQGGADESLMDTRFFQAGESGEAFTRRDFEEVAPPIVVESPKPHMEISSGAEVAGFANVYEGTVNIILTDEKDKKLVETFTTATCGSGCWGDFLQAIEFEVDKQQEGWLSVLTYSAEDGSPQHEIGVPVVLVP